MLAALNTRNFLQENSADEYYQDELNATAPTNDRSHSTLKNDPRLVSKAKYSHAPFNQTTVSPVDQTQAGSGFLGREHRSSEGGDTRALGQYTQGSGSKESHRESHRSGNTTLPSIDYSSNRDAQRLMKRLANGKVRRPITEKDFEYVY